MDTPYRVLQFDYYAANAPDVPKWFERKRWTTKGTIPWPEQGDGWMREVIQQHEEESLDHLVRWRVTYAKAMMAAMADTQTQV